MERNKKFLFLTFLLLLYFLFPFCDARAEKTADEVLEQVISAYKNIRSYKYVNEQVDLDKPISEREQKAKDKYSDSAIESIPAARRELKKKIDPEPEKEDKLIYRKGSYKYKFLKPYDVQVEILYSDYVPNLLKNSKLTYRSSKNSNVFYFKHKFLPFSIKRSAKDDVGDIFLMNWTYEIEEMKMLKRAGKLELLEDETLDDNLCYVVRVTLDPNIDLLLPDLAVENSDIPEEMLKEFKLRLNVYNTEKPDRIDKVIYWIDKSGFFIRQKERYKKEKMVHRRHFKDIEINKITEKDF